MKSNNRIVSGLQSLCAEQRPGQTFTQAQIAERCCVDENRIREIEALALHSLGRALYMRHRGFMRECFPTTYLLPNRTSARIEKRSFRSAPRSSTQTQCT
jgi:hypothetical protein